MTAAAQRANVSSCQHVEKAQNAVQAGAAAVIIVDTDDVPNVAISTDDLWAIKQGLSV
jgi:Zn-dependent M28 family amino/carboxypeptidase